MRHGRLRWLMPLFAALVLSALAGCGDDGGDDDTLSAGKAAKAARTTGSSTTSTSGATGGQSSPSVKKSGGSTSSTGATAAAADVTSTTESTSTSSTTVKSSSGARTLTAGTWGGEHAEMRIRDDGTTFEFDCAVGSVNSPLTVASDGSFEWKGTYVTERGNPNVQGEIDAQPATYFGTVSGERMTLTVDVPSLKIREGPYTLKEGARGFLRKCQ